MKRPALTIALIVALLVGLYTLWSIQQPDPPANALLSSCQQVLDYLILPGIIAGILLNASVHVASRWIISGANFIVYFGIAYGLARLWTKRKAKLATQQRKEL